ncbi:hypothetical protein MTO96_001547 [Rhipicephalus appendiculatus]
MVRFGLVAWLSVLAASSAIVAVSATSESSGGGNSKRLQIGVKRRVEKCDARSRKGDVLHMHYRGTLEDGTESSADGTRDCWQCAWVRSASWLFPPDLAYGSRGAPPTIPGDATLTFEVELVKIDRKTEL